MLLFWLGGASPATCKHVAATCYGLDDFTRMSTFLGSMCSTNTLCKWNAPPPQRRVSDMSFKRLTHSSLKALKRTASVRDEHDLRPPELRNPSCVKETEIMAAACGTYCWPQQEAWLAACFAITR